MLKNEESIILAALEAEISKSKHRLNSTNAERESMEKSVLVAKNDVEAATKHLAYLKESSADKDREIDLKRSTIEGLDIQINDKQIYIDKLQYEISGLSESLLAIKNDLASTEQKVLEHKDLISREHAHLSSRKAEIEENHRIVDEKIKKLSNSLKEIQ